MKITQDVITKELEANGFYFSRLVCGSKTLYHTKYPKNVTIFNSNLIDENLGKVWHGDLDLTLDGEKLQLIAKSLNTVFYVVREMDGRFENESRTIDEFKSVSVWNTNMFIPIYDSDFKIVPITQEEMGKMKKINAKWTCSQEKGLELKFNAKLPKKLIKAGQSLAKEVSEVSGKLNRGGDYFKKSLSKKVNETKRIFTTIKPLGDDILDAGDDILDTIGKNAKKLKEKFKGKKIELASTTSCDKYHDEIDRLLKIMGHEEALVTDMSTIGDFLDIFSSKKQRDAQLQKLSKKIGIVVGADDLIFKIASKISKKG